jgi:hypothetical protein
LVQAVVVGVGLLLLQVQPVVVEVAEVREALPVLCTLPMYSLIIYTLMCAKVVQVARRVELEPLVATVS